MTRCLFTSLLIGATLAGCGSTSTEETGDGDGTGLAMVGPGGAVVDGPDGARVEIPEGALEQDVEIRISMASTGFPTLNAAAMGPVFALEPHGLEFERPVRVTIPHAGKPAEIAMYTAQPGGQWEALRVDASGRTASAEVSHFSYFFNGRRPVRSRLLFF